MKKSIAFKCSGTKKRTRIHGIYRRFSVRSVTPYFIPIYCPKRKLCFPVGPRTYCHEEYKQIIPKCRYHL